MQNLCVCLSAAACLQSGQASNRKSRHYVDRVLGPIGGWMSWIIIYEEANQLYKPVKTEGETINELLELHCDQL